MPGAERLTTNSAVPSASPATKSDTLINGFATGVAAGSFSAPSGPKVGDGALPGWGAANPSLAASRPCAAARPGSAMGSVDAAWSALNGWAPAVVSTSASAGSAKASTLKAKPVWSTASESTNTPARERRSVLLAMTLPPESKLRCQGSCGDMHATPWNHGHEAYGASVMKA